MSYAINNLKGIENHEGINSLSKPNIPFNFVLPFTFLYSFSTLNLYFSNVVKIREVSKGYIQSCG